jgi:nicotinamidase/pyrazinamidase
VREGDAVVPVANRLFPLFVRRSLPVIVSRDWHPPNHCSFVEQGGEWPPHCVVDTPGAMFAKRLSVPKDALIVSKGTSPDRDAYSDFDETDLADRLRVQGTRRLFVLGIATDYCVLATVRDALRLDFDVVLLTDGIRAVNRNPGDGERAIREMQRAGARLATSDDVLGAAKARQME